MSERGRCARGERGEGCGIGRKGMGMVGFKEEQERQRQQGVWTSDFACIVGLGLTRLYLRPHAKPVFTHSHHMRTLPHHHRYRREAERRLRMASDMPGQGGGGGGGVRSVPASGGGSSKERRSKDRSSGRSSRSRAAASGTETKDPAAGAGSAGAGYGGPPTGK